MKFKKAAFLALLMTLCIETVVFSDEVYGPPLPPRLWSRLKEALFPKTDRTRAQQTRKFPLLLPEPPAPRLKPRMDPIPLAAQTKVLPLSKREAYVPKERPLENVSFDPSAFRNNAKLLSYSNRPVLPANPLQADDLKLVRGLFTLLQGRLDDASLQLHQLGVKSASKPIKAKALTFLGYALEEQDLPAIAAVSFARALDPHLPGQEAVKFNGYALAGLSGIAFTNAAAKTLAGASTLEKLAEVESMDSEARGFAYLSLAEKAFDDGKFESARKSAQAVPTNARWKERARYLAALCAYAAKPESRAAQELAGRELTDLFRTVEDSAVFDAVATALGRLHFLLGNYKAASRYLSQVTKETNLWLDSAIDNGWSLLKAGDKHQAVGNMFTLHTPFFEGAYMPDSYFMQTLGYQDLCQFGDAFAALKKYKLLYLPLTKSLAEFNAASKRSPQAGAAHYDELTAFLSKKESRLHPMVLRELGRHPEFLKRQSAINAMVRDERAAPLKMPHAGPLLAAWAKTTFAEGKRAFQSEIARFLRSRALNMEEELKFVNSNMALLEYEIYAGASRNIALQAAQNFALNERDSAKNEPGDDAKEYWPYEEEIWEDELNNFRSKIVDGCAKSPNRQPASADSPGA